MGGRLGTLVGRADGRKTRELPSCERAGSGGSPPLPAPFRAVAGTAVATVDRHQTAPPSDSSGCAGSRPPAIMSRSSSGEIAPRAAEAVDALIAGGADPNARDERDRTPLYWAVENGYREVINALLDAGAKAGCR